MTLYSIKTTKTWGQPVRNSNFEVSDVAPTYTRSWLLALKEGLVNAELGAWTVLASSARVGGTTWTADTSDLWTDRDEVQWGATGNDHAWAVLKSPTGDYGPFYLILDYTDASLTYQGSVFFTKSQPTLTGLLTTARPTATGDEWSHQGVILHASGVVQNHRGNLMLAHDGSFVWAAQSGSDGIFTSALLFNIMARGSIRADDTVRAASLHWSNRSVKLSFTSGFRFRMLHPADGSEVDAAGVAPACGLPDNYLRTTSIATDMALNTWPALPVDLFSVTGGKLALRGRLEDIWWAPEFLADSSPATAGNILQATSVGPFWVPTTEPILKP